MFEIDTCIDKRTYCHQSETDRYDNIEHAVVDGKRDRRLPRSERHIQNTEICYDGA